MSRRRVRQLIIIGILLLLLLLGAIAYINYTQTRDIGFGLDLDAGAILPAPQYLYSFGGDGPERLMRPVGVLTADGRVYVTDSRRGVIEVYRPEGDRIATWGKGKLLVPLYIAKHPKTGDLWVTDRRLRGLFVFGSDGTFKREFDPKLPKEQLPTFDTGGVQWAPVGIGFGPDGTIYVTEILKGHRLLIFAPDGKFKRSVGNAGIATKVEDNPEAFQFPNEVEYHDGEVWVSDSNNRRIQVFTPEGDFVRIVGTSGLPRGFDFLPQRSNEPSRVVVIDTLAHDGTIWDAGKSAKIVSFGTHGVLEGQFSYPTDTSVDARSRIFITDTGNGRVQVWGWPEQANPVPTPRTPAEWALCLSPLLLLPLLMLLRRRRYMATADFVEALVAMERADAMVQRRVKWLVTEADYERLRGIVQGEVHMDRLLEPTPYSESDARALKERFEIGDTDAIVLSIAQRAKLFCTEDVDLRRIARVLEIDTVDHDEYLERMAGEAPSGDENRPPGG